MYGHLRDNRGYTGSATRLAYLHRRDEMLVMVQSNVLAQWHSIPLHGEHMIADSVLSPLRSHSLVIKNSGFISKLR